MKHINLIFSGILPCLFLMVSCHNGEGVYDASGTFEATDMVVSAQANGTILQLDVNEGDSVASNQTLGFIDTTQLFLQKRMLTIGKVATLNKRPNVGKQIAAIQVALAQAKAEEKRIENLYKGDAATEQQLDDIRSKVRQLQAQLNAQTNNLENNITVIDAESSAQEVQIAQVEDQLLKCRIYSPICGIVLDKYAQKGEQASMGRPLFKVADLNHMVLRAYITSSQISNLKLGQNVEVFTLQKEQTQSYPGKITWISDQAEFTPKTIQTKDERANLVYAIKISVINDGYLKIGMYADVKF
ncbi:MAG: efflux RND transporter periplasmic adaptor subunit [Bacteroidales bacterium]